MNSNLLISHMLWDDHQTDYFVVTSLCPIISRQPSSGSYRLEDGTLFLHLHLPLLDQAYHLHNLQDFPVAGPSGKSSTFDRTPPTPWRFLTGEDIRTLGAGGFKGLPYHRSFLPLWAALCQEGLYHFVHCCLVGGFGARRGGKVHCCASD